MTSERTRLVWLALTMLESERLPAPRPDDLLVVTAGTPATHLRQINPQVVGAVTGAHTGAQNRRRGRCVEFRPLHIQRSFKRVQNGCNLSKIEGYQARW